MSHDAPVTTISTQAAAQLKPAPLVTIVFDVADLKRTSSFYETHLGFRVVATERVGLPYETNVLVSDRFPGVALCARKTFQRPVAGTVIGGIVQVGLRDPELTRRIDELEGKVVWVLAPAKEEPGRSASPRISFLDPDGYIVELYR